MNDRRIALWINYAIIFSFAAVVTISSPLLMYIASTFSLSLSQAGILFTANFVGFVSLILMGGILADRYSKKTVLTASLTGISFSLFLFTLVPNIYLACVMMFLIGGFGGSIESVSNSIIIELYPDNATFYINLAQVFFGMGALLGPVTVGVMLGMGISWQSCYFTLGIIFLVLTVAFASIKLPLLPSEERLSWTDFTYLVKDQKFLLICLCLFLYTGSEVGGWGWLSTFVKQNLRFSAVKSSLAVGVFWMSMIIGRFICTLLTRKVRIGYMVIMLSFLASIVTWMFGILSSNQYFIWLLVTLMGLTYSGIWPLLVSYGCAQFEKNKGTVSALLMGSGGIGASIIPLSMGVIAQLLDTSWAIITPALLLFLLGFIFWWLSVSRISRAVSTEIPKG